MLITIHQPESFPWIGFIAKMRRADKIILLESVQFKKHYFENRNKVRTSQGWTWLTIPVKTSGRLDQPIRDVEILPSPNWQRKISETIRQSYRKAPYWKLGGDELCALIERPWTRLVDLNLAVISYLFERFEVRAPVTLSSSLDPHTHGSELVLEICRMMNADRYLSGRDGRNYLDLASFAAAGVTVDFQDFHHPVYPQIHGEFVPGLSSIDLWFNCGPAGLRIIEDAQAPE